MKKILSIFLGVTLFMGGLTSSFGTEMEVEEIKNTDTGEYEKQLEAKNAAIEEFNKNSISVEDVYEMGSLYWKGDTLTLGIKKRTQASRALLSRSNTKAFENKGLAIEEIDYTTNELIKMLDEVEETYLATEEKDNYIEGGVKDNVGKITIRVKSISDETKQILEDKFPDRVLIDENENHVKPEPTVSRSSDYDELGAGITGTYIKSNPKGACTIGATAVKNGVPYLVTAGHCLPNIGQNYYQFYSKVGTQHTNAAGYNYSDIGLVRINDSAFTTLSGKNYTRKITRGLYLNDEYKIGYSGEITSVMDFPMVGDIVQKSGQTTGITEGRINHNFVKVEYKVDGKDYPLVYCVRVDPIGSTFFSQSGDSGSPVYIKTASNKKTLVGFVSGTNNLTGEGYFAPAHQLYSSFGNDFQLMLGEKPITVN